MNNFYIAISGDFYGYFGNGFTEDEAKKNLRKAGGKIKGCRIEKFTSELPFVGLDKRQANENEADAWIGKDGSINWIRCERAERVKV